jgi:hypothetical protein
MEEEDIVLACTTCRVVYVVALLDQSERVLQVPGFCPFCGNKYHVTDALLTTLSERRLELIPGGKK